MQPKTLWYIQDALGSTLGLVEKDGRVSSRYHYDEFGVPQDAKKFDLNWPGPDNLFGYTGLGYDFTSSNTYAGARYYKPEIGRFVSEDTYKGQIDDPQTLNLYTYVENNPLLYTDPSGHTKEWETYEVHELRGLLNDVRAKNYSKFDKYFQAAKDVIWNRYNFASFMTTNQYNYLYGLLTGTSPYKNSAGNADWAREQLISAFYKSKEVKYIALLALGMRSLSWRESRCQK
ncbi:RHS repeat domain-containing protein [Paenibacillus zanthoxyli]|uniref:RHS repeat domain-containing protein n=1 Tax=Paenibacillus zanthoxyli TaxID=369399 RepID=UPI00046FB635|nr:RHS repeat-associated core domain-containing protein [Paenibacillus zanthoxyli]